jgi:hypothetical protein
MTRVDPRSLLSLGHSRQVTLRGNPQASIQNQAKEQ